MEGRCSGRAIQSNSNYNRALDPNQSDADGVGSRMGLGWTGRSGAGGFQQNAIEALQMTQSVEAFLMVVKPAVESEKVLYGDNSNDLAIPQNPDGVGRTGHPRLQS